MHNYSLFLIRLGVFDLVVFYADVQIIETLTAVLFCFLRILLQTINAFSY